MSFDPCFEWLPERFAALVATAERQWIGLSEAVSFLTTGACRAIDTIYESVGTVGPPVRPEPGSIYLVDERRLPTWRNDGYGYGRRLMGDAAPGGSGGSLSSGVSSKTIPFAFPPTAAAAANPRAPGPPPQPSVVLEWSRVFPPADVDGSARTDASARAGVQQRRSGKVLQRRAVRLPRMDPQDAEALFARLAPPQLARSQRARERECTPLCDPSPPPPPSSPQCLMMRRQRLHLPCHLQALSGASAGCG
jgi:hypothetical protein